LPIAALFGNKGSDFFSECVGNATKGLTRVVGCLIMKMWKRVSMEKIRPRYSAIMELMLMAPHLNQNEIAEKLNYTPSRLSIIINHPLFQMAYQSLRVKHQDRISGSIVDATMEAIEVSREIMNKKDELVSLRQTSAKMILDQGHAKAIEKRATLSATAEIPAETLRSLGELAKELSQPFTPRRFLQQEERAEEVVGGLGA